MGNHNKNTTLCQGDSPVKFRGFPHSFCSSTPFVRRNTEFDLQTKLNFAAVGSKIGLEGRITYRIHRKETGDTSSCRMNQRRSTASWKAKVLTISTQSYWQAARFGAAAIGRGGLGDRARHRQSTGRDRRLWIVTEKKFDGPHPNRNQNTAEPPMSQSPNLCVPR